MLGKFNTVIANSTVDEMLGLRVLQQAEPIIGARRKHLGEGLARTAAWVERNAALVEWVRPGRRRALLCPAAARSSSTTPPSRASMRRSPRLDARVGNGTWFGEEPRVFRLGFGFLPMAELDAALEALTAALQQAKRKRA